MEQERSPVAMRGSCLVLLALILAGCGSSSDNGQPQPVISTPLELDPTEHYELSRWWFNGRELLRLDQNAGYALFDNGNRYRTPLERGRWDQQNYATLWLEPYSRQSPQRRRVGIEKIDGEDRLIGRWTGPMGTLELANNSRYSLAAAVAPSGASTVVRTSSRGHWTIEGETLVLHADTPGVDPERWPMRVDDKQVVIRGRNGEFTQAAHPNATAG
jgi:hypothetical protein